AVNLVQVDVVGVQPAQAGLDAVHDALAGRPPLVGPVAHGVAHLGGHDDLVAAAFDGPADGLLGPAAGVRVGGVDEVDAQVQRPVNDALDAGRVHLAAELVRADTDNRNLKTGAAQSAILHAFRLLRCSASFS